MNMRQDLERLSEILRKLTPQHEKVVRLNFGLGCRRSHSVAEIAAEFAVPTALITGIVDAATKRLTKSGVTVKDLKEAAREPTALRTHSRHRHQRPE